MLIVGLGNPGKEYERTHHNAGFIAVDKIIEAFSVQMKDEKKFQASCGTFIYQGVKHHIIKPLTYMNLSGNAVSAYANYYKIAVEDILVFYDDMDLNVGAIRIRKNGSAGGHNGIKSIIASLGTQDFKRVRIGIGRGKNQSGEGIIDYVLSCFSKQEMTYLEPTFEKMPSLTTDYIDKGIDFIMNKYN